jgi:ribosomal protein S6
MEKETTEGAVITRVYELGYLLVPTLAEEKVRDAAQKIKNTLSQFGATIISEDSPVLIDLAYTMAKTIENKKEKFDEAYFGWIKFEVLPEGLASVKNWCDNEVDLIRFIIIKTVRENTVSSKKSLAKDSAKKRQPVLTEEVEAPKEVIDEKVIDEQIEELVAEK